MKTLLKDFTVKSFSEILPPQVERRHVIDVEGSLPLPQTQQHVSARAVGNTAVVQQNRTEPSHHYAFIVRFKQWLKNNYNHQSISALTFVFRIF